MTAGRKRRKPRKPQTALTPQDRAEAKAVGQAVEAKLLREAGERFARTQAMIETRRGEVTDLSWRVFATALRHEMSSTSYLETGNAWILEDANQVAAVMLCLGFGPMIAGVRFERDVDAALASGRSEVSRALNRIAADKRRAAKPKAPKRGQGTQSPIGGEGPSRDHLGRQAVVSPSVADANKPRHARLSGELPRPVMDMVRRGWLTATEASALRFFADDFELGASMGPSGPGELRERVDGGPARRAEAGRSGQSLAAWQRYVAGKRVIGDRLSKAVEAVMIQGVSLGDVQTPHSKKNAGRAGAAAWLMAAGELLARHYTELGYFEKK